MADLPRADPWRGLALPQLPGLLTLTPHGDAARLSLRGEAASLAPLGAALGLVLPTTPCRAATSGTRAALWLGPDEWLILTPPDDPVRDTLAAAIPAGAGALVDISHRQAALTISGPAATEVLNAGCPLDLDAPAFAVGMCTRTICGKASIVLWRQAMETFHFEVGRSFAAYAAGLLSAAARLAARRAG